MPKSHPPYPPEFRRRMVLDDLPIDDLLEAWMERALRHQLPTWVRDTRRETHFLRGVRPTAILMADERGTNRPLLAAAGRADSQRDEYPDQCPAPQHYRDTDCHSVFHGFLLAT